jgi:short subunit dehydrogenase-like uncharacterized protein
MAQETWMLYGANGYTGELCAEEAIKRGQKPILAGRRADAVRPLAEKLGLPWRAFPLDDPGRIAEQLAGVKAVLLCAGPFSHTSAPVVEACLKAGTHYLDVTGEIVVFEACHRKSKQAKERGVVIMPGVGFDVVPSDCLAAALKRALPDAVKLQLAFAGMHGVSRGTAKTMAEGIGKGGAVREGGRIKVVPLGYKTRTVPFRDKPRFAMTIPWGDVSTAFHSTGIPDIEVYMAVPPSYARTMKWIRPIAPLLDKPLPQRALKALIDRRTPGPDAEARNAGRVQLWGRAENAAGRTVDATLVTPEGYKLTAEAALECMLRVLGGKVPPGAHTPSTAFGASFVTELAGCDLKVAA